MERKKGHFVRRGTKEKKRVVRAARVGKKKELTMAGKREGGTPARIEKKKGSRLQLYYLRQITLGEGKNQLKRLGQTIPKKREGTFAVIIKELHYYAKKDKHFFAAGKGGGEQGVPRERRGESEKTSLTTGQNGAVGLKRQAARVELKKMKEERRDLTEEKGARFLVV